MEAARLVRQGLNDVIKKPERQTSYYPPKKKLRRDEALSALMKSNQENNT